MLLLDVNVVLAAHRHDHPHHAPVRGWFDEMLTGDERFTVPALVWGSFLRLATNRRIFGVPTPRPEAFAFIDATCDQPLHLTGWVPDRATSRCCAACATRPTLPAI